MQAAPCKGHELGWGSSKREKTMPGVGHSLEPSFPAAEGWGCPSWGRGLGSVASTTLLHLDLLTSPISSTHLGIAPPGFSLALFPRETLGRSFVGWTISLLLHLLSRPQVIFIVCFSSIHPAFPSALVRWLTSWNDWDPHPWEAWIPNNYALLKLCMLSIYVKLSKRLPRDTPVNHLCDTLFPCPHHATAALPPPDQQSQWYLPGNFFLLFFFTYLLAS